MSDGDKLDEFHAHESMHTAYVQCEVWGAYVMDSRYVQTDAELMALAEKALDQMWALYNAIAAKHLTRPCPTAQSNESIPGQT